MAKTTRKSARRAEQPEVAVACVSNVYMRMMTFKRKGDVELGHKHPYDHASLLSAGSLRVEVEGERKDFKAPAVIFVRANAQHQLSALADNTIITCIHALRVGERVDDILPPDAVISAKDRERLIGALRELEPVP
jgi:quercetin dioxygenase-like cupin family protein